MDNFIVSARKYRPETFDTVVEQESITQTLKNAIRNNHLAQAYLFCGPRGVGKTTTARIFAKTLNCKNPGPNIEPCGQCESCVAFAANRSYNIHELDAASNNTVDDIRLLIEKVRIPPQLGRFSVYIIDEVHMLSAQAFNAFLKTLEEPPVHALFILATTEKHKIIPTILSRCQIFDFNRIQINTIVRQLCRIDDREKITYEIDGFNIIAQKADGSMRDALSIYDQIVSFCGSNVRYKDVIENLNVLDYEYYFRLVDLFLDNNYTQSLLIFNEVLNHGFDARNFLSGLSSHLRDLLISRDKITLPLLEVGDSIRERYYSQTALCSAEFLIRCMEIVTAADYQYNASRNKRLHVELALIQLCNVFPGKNKLTVNEDEPKYRSSKPAVQPAQVKPQPADPATPAAPANRPPDSFSIKQAMKMANHPVPPAANTDIKAVEDAMPPTPFTADEANNAWIAFAESVKLTEQRLYSSLIKLKPQVEDGNTFLLTIHSRIEEELFMAHKPAMISFFRKTLNNPNVDIRYIVAAIKDDAPRLYTDEEKYKHLTKVNPAIDKLRQSLNLDFE